MLFADRTSAEDMRANQIRLYLSSIGYVLLSAMRRIGLADTSFERAQCSTIRLKSLKVGALVRITVRKIWISFSQSYPYREQFSQDSCEDSQHAACCPTLLTHHVDRFGDATDGRHVGPRANRADPSAPRPNRSPRMPCQPPIVAHVFAKPAPHRHAMLVPRPNPAQDRAIPRPERNAG